MEIIKIAKGTQAWETLRDLLNDDRLYQVRIAIDEGTVKVKADEFVWTPPLTGATTGEAAR